MMKIAKFAKKYYDLIKEGYSFKDKITIGLYFPNFILNRFSKKKRYNLICDVTLKNEDGIFFCGNNIFSAWAGSMFGEKDIQKYFTLDKGVFIDIGANIGKYTVKIGNQLKNNGKVVGIEPQPINFKALEKNVGLNNLKNVFLKNVACSDSNGFTEFYIDNVGNYGGGHSLIKNERSSNEKIIVKTQKLDTILKELKIDRTDLIKIDVEGAESLVLKGALETLKNSHPKIIFEAWDESYLNKVKEVLKPFNYKIKKINEQNYFAY